MLQMLDGVLLYSWEEFIIVGTMLMELTYIDIYRILSDIAFIMCGCGTGAQPDGIYCFSS